MVEKKSKTGPIRRSRPSQAEAPLERVGLIELSGIPATVIGPDVRVGQPAPEFSAQAGDWSEVRPIESTTGRVRVILSLPSLSTDVCDRVVRRFSESATALSADIIIWAVSADLPTTQRTWCAAKGISRVQAISDHMHMEFGLKYGCWIKERRWLRRAVFVIDRDDTVVYAAYMHNLGIEPNYEEVLATAKAVL